MKTQIKKYLNLEKKTEKENQKFEKMTKKKSLNLDKDGKGKLEI